MVYNYQKSPRLFCRTAVLGCCAASRLTHSCFEAWLRSHHGHGSDGLMPEPAKQHLQGVESHAPLRITQRLEPTGLEFWIPKGHELQLTMSIGSPPFFRQVRCGWHIIYYPTPIKLQVLPSPKLMFRGTRRRLRETTTGFAAADEDLATCPFDTCRASRLDDVPTTCC